MDHQLKTKWIVWNMWILFLWMGMVGCGHETPGCRMENSETKDSLIVVESNGTSSYEILVSNSSSASAKEGALELQRLVNASTGVQLPIVSEGSTNRHQIVIGEIPPLKQAQADMEQGVKDSYVMSVDQRNIYLCGIDDQQLDFYSFKNERVSSGSYLAVLEFARRFIGVQWFMPGPFGEEITTCSSIRIPSTFYLFDKPRFPIRSLDVVQIQDCSGNQKLGYHQEKVREVQAWGRHLRLGASYRPDFQHAWYIWVPAEEPLVLNAAPQAYGASHPEFFALKNGQRTNFYRNKSWHAGAQLCVSNPDVVRTVAENMIAYSKRTGSKYLSLSENDGAGYCECEGCKAWDVVKMKDGDSEESLILTDRLVTFANQVAEKVIKEVPDIQIGLYAYHNSLSPPLKSRVHPSVIISDVYNNWACFYHCLPSRLKYGSFMKEWRAQCKKIVMTSYYFNDGYNWSLPWSTVDAQAMLVQVMAESSSSEGIRLNYGQGDGAPVGVLGPDPWIMSELLWNPHQSLDDLKNRYYQGAFGTQVGPLIRQYYETIDQVLSKAFMDRFGEKVEFELYITRIAPLIIPAYKTIRSRCHSLIGEAVQIASRLPERYQWRVDCVARSWKFAELTLDAVEATQRARWMKSADAKAVWEKAVALGLQRQAMFEDPQNVYSLSLSGLKAEKTASLGVVTEMPDEADFVLMVPNLKENALLDGRMDDGVWKQAVSSSRFVDNYKKQSIEAGTRVKSYYNQNGLYFAFDCQEPQMSQLKAIDSIAELWNGDVVEVFLVPPGDVIKHLHFTVNPNGVGKEAYDGVFKWQTDWKYTATKGESGWVVEIFLPWKSLGVNGAPQKGEEWRLGLFRERYTGKKELSAWTPTRTSFATPEKFGFLQFSE